MRLISCHVENFGKLHDYDHTFTEGVNSILKENGWGKTTLSVFIKAMLFSLPRTTKRSIVENERKHYQPWQSGPYGGTLTIEVGGKIYRIERYFNQEGDDSFGLYDAKTNLPSDDFSENIGEKVFGLNASAYERSTFFSAREVGGDYETSITAKLNGLIEDEEDIGAFDKAIQKLDEKRKIYRQDKGENGLLKRLEAEHYALVRQLEEAKRAEEGLAVLKERGVSLQRDLENYEKALADAEEAYILASNEKARMELQSAYRSLNLKLKEDRAMFEREEAFFHGSVPSEEELSAVQSLLSKREELKGQRNGLSIEDYNDVRRAFLNGLPTYDEEEVKDAATVADSLIQQYQSLSMPLDEDAEMFREELPLMKKELSENDAPTVEESDRVIDERQLAYSKASEEKNLFRQKEQPKKHLGGFIAGLSVFGALLLAGGVLLLLYFVLPLEPWAMIASIVGGGLGLIGVGVFLPLLIVKAKKDASTIEAYLKEEQETNEAFETALSELQKAQEVSIRARRKKDLTDRINYDEEELKTYEKGQELLQKIGEVEQSLRVLGQKRGNESWAVRYYHFKRSVDEYKKYLEVKEKEETLSKEIEKIDAGVKTFEEKFGANLEGVRAHKANYEFGKEALQRQERILSDFEEEKGVSYEILSESLSDRTEEINRYRGTCRKMKEGAEEKIRVHLREVESLTLVAEKASELEVQIEANDLARKEGQEKYEILADTKKFLIKAKTDLSSLYMEQIHSALEEYAKRFSLDKVGAFSFDTNMDIVFRSYGKKQDFEALSQGYQAVVSLVSRFALVKALFPEEKPFLVLDDPFADLDGENLKTALEVLKDAASDYQIVYFVCHESRKGEV